MAGSIDIFGNLGLDIFDTNNAYIAQLMARARTALYIPTTSAWTETKVGSSTSTIRPFSFYLTTGGVSEAASVMETTLAALLTAGSGTRVNCIDWAKELWLIFSVERGTDIAAALSFVQLKHISTIGALGERGLGARMTNLTLIGNGYDTVLGSNTLLTMTVDQTYRVEIRNYPSVPKTEFWVDRVLKATETTSTKVPQTQATTGDDYLVVSQQKTSGDSNSTLYVSPIWIFQF